MYNFFTGITEQKITWSMLGWLTRIFIVYSDDLY